MSVLSANKSIDPENYDGALDKQFFISVPLHLPALLYYSTISLRFEIKMSFLCVQGYRVVFFLFLTQETKGRAKVLE